MLPLIQTMQDNSRFDVAAIACGMHLLPEFGHSLEVVKSHVAVVAEIHNLDADGSHYSKSMGMGKLVSALTEVVAKEQPDYLVFLGDREEVLAGALVCTYMHIPSIHLAGGDNTDPEGGDVDEAIRHAASKLSHLHLTMCEEHSQRLIQMGEQGWRVHTLGSVGLDRLRLTPHITRLELEQKVSPLVGEKYAIFIYHPLSSETAEDYRQHVRDGLHACFEKGLNVLAGGPNSDPGCDIVMEELRKFDGRSDFLFYRNLPELEFVNLLRHAEVLVGNSSLGLHEAGFLGLPVVNIGLRQYGRLSDGNVVYAIEPDQNRLMQCLDQAMSLDLVPGNSVYGDGYSCDRFNRIMSELPPKQELLDKRITY